MSEILRIGSFFAPHMDNLDHSHKYVLLLLLYILLFLLLVFLFSLYVSRYLY